MQAVRIYGLAERSHFRAHWYFSGADLPPALSPSPESQASCQRDAVRPCGIAAKRRTQFLAFSGRNLPAHQGKLLAVTMIPAKIPKLPWQGLVPARGAHPGSQAQRSDCTHRLVLSIHSQCVPASPAQPRPVSAPPPPRPGSFPDPNRTLMCIRSGLAYTTSWHADGICQRASLM